MAAKMTEVKRNPVAAFLLNFSLDEFNAEEKDFVIKTRMSQFLASLNFNISSAAALDMYMKHSGGSSTVMAMHYGTVQSSTNLCNMLLAPAVGCLSDTIGRKPLMMAGRCGWVLWWITLANIDAIAAATKFTQLRIRLIGEVVCWGIIQAGSWSAYTAAQAVSPLPLSATWPQVIPRAPLSHSLISRKHFVLREIVCVCFIIIPGLLRHAAGAHGQGRHYRRYPVGPRSV